MFEDALVDSGNRIRTRSRYWVLATTSFNLAALAGMTLYPMMYPQALPKTALLATIQAPPIPAAAAPKPSTPQVVRRTSAVAPLDPMHVPPRIPINIRQMKDDPPPSTELGVAAGETMVGNGDPKGVTGILMASTNAPLVQVRPQQPRKPAVQRVSAGVMAGQIINKTQPLYPAIARAAGVSGTVTLHAFISKNGTIENLSVVSGPEMLRSSAVEAVKQWRYRPYLLNGDPTEVDTTITVNFTIGS